MLHYIYKAGLYIAGWKAVGMVPPHLKKFVLVVAPHTSSWDVVLGFAFRSALQLGRIRFIAKKELFQPPFGNLFKWVGGVPVDRSASHNFVDQVVDLFNKAPAFAIALSPEGTRKKVDRLKTGFYHIARKAGVPLILLAVDYKNKEFRFSAPIITSESEAGDIKRILLFFAGATGKHREDGIGHLVG